LIDLLIILIAFLMFIAGFCFGMFQRNMWDAIKAFEKPEPRKGVTYGAYKRPDDLRPQNPHSKIVEPKTPQKIESDAQEQRLKETMGGNRIEI
jgi:hypothetical protein